MSKEDIHFDGVLDRYQEGTEVPDNEMLGGDFPTIRIIDQGLRGFFGMFLWETDQGLKGRVFQDLEDVGLLRSRLEDFAEKQGFELDNVKREGVQ
jgi:hypothetical protein